MLVGVNVREATVREAVAREAVAFLAVVSFFRQHVKRRVKQ